jgi:hypothetical protein
MPRQAARKAAVDPWADRDLTPPQEKAERSTPPAAAVSSTEQAAASSARDSHPARDRPSERGRAVVLWSARDLISAAPVVETRARCPHRRVDAGRESPARSTLGVEEKQLPLAFRCAWGTGQILLWQADRAGLLVVPGASPPRLHEGSRDCSTSSRAMAKAAIGESSSIRGVRAHYGLNRGQALRSCQSERCP